MDPLNFLEGRLYRVQAAPYDDPAFGLSGTVQKVASSE